MNAFLIHFHVIEGNKQIFRAIELPIVICSGKVSIENVQLKAIDYWARNSWQVIK